MCHVHTCQPHPATDNDTIFTTMIIFQDVLKQKVLFKNALWLSSDKGGYQLAKEIHILQPERGGFCMGNIICCQEKYLEVSGMKSVLAEIKIVGSIAANSAVKRNCN